MLTDTITPVHDHPAKFSKTVLDVLQDRLDYEDERRLRPLTIFDPFAGIGRVHELATPHGLHTIGVELEPEWAACHPRTICGNALRLPFAPGSMDGLVTSPCYGNRMADAHKAADPCRSCDGRGWFPVDTISERKECAACRGSGLTRRNTYTHRLRVATKDPDRDLHPENAGTLRWGPKYRQFHERAYREAVHAIRPGGFALINISNHIQTMKGQPVEHRVTEWTLNVWLTFGCYLLGAFPVTTQRQRDGANGEARAESEFVLHFRLPDTRPAPTLF